MAWIHANLAQLSYDRDHTDPAAGPKTIFHCRELLRLGFMQPWARRIIAELDKSGNK